MYRQEGSGKTWKGKKQWAEVDKDELSFKLYDVEDWTVSTAPPPADLGRGKPVLDFPLMLATVKEERDALIPFRFCFRIITPQVRIICNQN